MKHQLELKWSVSKARDTYGYNRLTITDGRGFKDSCCGGGYDMQGTAFASFINAKYENRFYNLDQTDYYGLYTDSKNERYVNGSCGLECVRKIAEAIGLKLEFIYSKGLKFILVEDTKIKDEQHG